MSFRGWLLTSALSFMACGPEKTVGADETGSDEGTGATTAGTNGPTTSAATTTDGTGASGSVTTDPSGDTSGGACAPPDFVQAGFSIDPEPFGDAISVPCTVQGMGGDDATTTFVDLTCMTEDGAVPYSITIISSLQSVPALYENQEVELEVVSEPIFWINRWFAIREDGTTLVAGIDSSHLDPPGSVIGKFVYPLLVKEAADLCRAIEDDCSAVERLALDVTFGATEERIFDHDSRAVGSRSGTYMTVVERAVRYEPPIHCTDLPSAWYEAIFVLAP